MNPFASLATRSAISFLLAVAPIMVKAVPTQTQTFNLRPGWNAVFLEVQPAANTPGEVFQGVAFESLWMLKTRTLSVEFIQNPNEAVTSNAEWLRFIPTNRVESFQNTLFRIAANRAYLIKVTDSAPVTLSVTGRPVLRPLEWQPDAYVLRGFPVDPASPPTFGRFFRGSTAHFDPIVRRIQPIYRLNSAGEWTLADSEDTIAPGEAYWVFTKGSSEYPGPFSVSVPFGETFDFTREVQRQNLTFSDHSGDGLTISLRDVVAPGANLLSYLNPDPTGDLQYFPLPSPYDVTLAANETSNLGLSMRRQEMVNPVFETVLEASDGAGTRFLIPVLAGKLLGTAEAALLKAQTGDGGIVRRSLGPIKLSPPQEAQSHVGLWSGIVTINAVSEAHSSDPTAPTPVENEFRMRILLHVDENGVTRLLREVIQMVRQGAFISDATGKLVRSEPDRAVLVTDFSKLSQFSGVSMRDGALQGRRLCSVGFNFAASNTNNFVEMDGNFAVGQALSGQLNLPSTQPTNPFLHRYHPDHDNLATDFRQFKEEAISVTRMIQLEFSAPPADSKVPDYGYNQMDGIYRETLSGLHRQDIHTSGAFQLTRITTVGRLNE
ncbi:MAG: hypothetical protein O2960_24190 [Verrucomicrobia bacterium]|nr:hypothetical protein [Verrucomicrobiota bacterium]